MVVLSTEHKNKQKVKENPDFLSQVVFFYCSAVLYLLSKVLSITSILSKGTFKLKIVS